MKDQLYFDPPTITGPGGTTMLWYVYRFNGVAEDFECIGAFSREDEAAACLTRERAEWKESSNGAPMADHLFPGTCIRETWSEFCERAVRYRLGKLSAPIEFLAKSGIRAQM